MQRVTHEKNINNNNIPMHKSNMDYTSRICLCECINQRYTFVDL